VDFCVLSEEMMGEKRKWEGRMKEAGRERERERERR
jgi:hypothetical protein